MAKEFSNYNLLDAVTEATAGTALEMERQEAFTVVVNPSVNTGAVTITISASIDGTTFVTLDETTKTANTVPYSYSAANTPYKSIKAVTTTQSDSTVSVDIMIQG